MSARTVTSPPKRASEHADKKARAKKKTASNPGGANGVALEGLRFPCSGMHLAVLGGLAKNDLMKLPLKKLLRGLEVDAKSDDIDAILRAAVARLHEVPIDPKAAAQLTALDFDGCNAIYLDIEELLDNYTGGETDAYNLDSIEGIDKLPALKDLSLDAFGYKPGGIDLKPLEGHPSLSSLRLTGQYIHPETLETLPKLSTIRGSGKLGAKLVARLKAKRVALADGFS